ncbi:MAG TPA: WhiB family transcriptional regulator [Micropruina sp.]|nr:WhiB family transcriptional regulator [Micropruina sp.]
MPNATRAERATCLDDPTLFQHPLLEDPSAARPDAERLRQAALLAARAATACARCPLFDSCLYEAVVTHDVAGFVAGTTEAQRRQIRAALKVTVAKEDFDTIAGVVGGNRQIDHDELVRLRRANPQESLEVLAMRLGCSLSTVKRHLRRARGDSEVKLAVVRPTMERVLAAFATVAGAPSRGREQRVA